LGRSEREALRAGVCALLAAAGVFSTACEDEARFIPAPDPDPEDRPLTPDPAQDPGEPGPNQGNGGSGSNVMPPSAGMGGASGNGGSPEPEPGEFQWNLPPGFPPPPVPADNPMSVAKVELGRHLFYDERLSANQSMSCATCHRQELAFTDNRAVAVGSTGESHSRGSMSLANVAYASTLTWSHPYLGSLERQAAVPMFGTAPVELGLTSADEIEQRLRLVAEYQDLFASAFPDDAEPITVLNLTRALAAFQRTLISGRSAYDRWAYDADESAISESAKRGFELFYSERLECFHCHAGFGMTDHVTYQGQREPGTLYHNTGLYNVDAMGAYPAPNTGIYDVTQDPQDMGKFKAPTLRNIAITAPYMHDGSIATLSEVLDHYAAGGRTIESGPYAGAGSESPLQSDLIRGFELSEEERTHVLDFLESLTDEEFITDPALSNPWTE
jgi:cytochrome c peroxidase